VARDKVQYCMGPWNDAYRAFISAYLGAPSNLFPFLVVFFVSILLPRYVCLCHLPYFRKIINGRF
jgi:hypothetical protein